MKVIITIPAYNEEKTLPRVLTEIKDVLKEGKDTYEFFVLNDGSTDKTVDVAQQHGAFVVSNKRNRGLAETFKREMEECLKRKAEIIVHTDADGQYDPQAILPMIEKVKQGYDLVLGSRFRGKIESMPFLKWWGNKAFSHVLTSLTGVKITDSTTGFRAFTPEVARDIQFINTFTYTQEQIIKAAKMGFRIGEVAVRARKTRASRLFKNPFEYAIKAWINILRIYRDYNPLQFFGRIGLTFLGTGITIGLWLVYRFIVYGRIGKVPSAILSMLLIVIGIQVILFGFLADMKR